MEARRKANAAESTAAMTLAAQHRDELRARGQDPSIGAVVGVNAESLKDQLMQKFGHLPPEEVIEE